MTLATEEPPAFVLSHATGKLDTLYVKNGSAVEADTDLGVIGNAACSDDVRLLKKWMKAWDCLLYTSLCHNKTMPSPLSRYHPHSYNNLPPTLSTNPTDVYKRQDSLDTIKFHFTLSYGNFCISSVS